MLYSAKDYLDLIPSWNDPNPKPTIRIHDDVHVVRDDLLEVGTKARAADYIIGHAPEFKHIEEWVYPSPATGYAQISLAYVCKEYNKKAVLFSAERSMDKLHAYQKRGLEYGGEYHWIPNGMFNVVNHRAKKYVEESPNTRMLLPMGLNHKYATACFVKSMLSIDIKPKEVWSVFSSGTLSRALQIAFPEADIHAVHAGGHRGDTGKAILHESMMPFDREVKKKDRPPFPSPASYDAKAWLIMKKYYETNTPKGPVMFWNVAA